MVASAAQDLIDRRRLRRKLGFWRVAALLALVLALFLVPRALGWKGLAPVAADHIARVAVEGLITEDEDLLGLLAELKDDRHVRAVILKVDSPGGTTVGGETLFRAVRELAAAKPVASQVGTLAASAAYMVAIASDHIVAHNTSIVGSIGVIFQYVDASALLRTVGVDVKSVKSGLLKAEPSPFGPAPPEATAMIQRLVNNTFNWFVGLVVERRALSEEAVRALADGSIFTGEEGLANHLVDALGDEAEARRWLEKERGVPAGLDVVDREPKSDDDGWSLFALARAALFETLGLDPRARSMPDAVFGRAAHLDGLLSLWQPPAGFQ